VSAWPYFIVSIWRNLDGAVERVNRLKTGRAATMSEVRTGVRKTEKGERMALLYPHKSYKIPLTSVIGHSENDIGGVGARSLRNRGCNFAAEVNVGLSTRTYDCRRRQIVRVLV